MGRLQGQLLVTIFSYIYIYISFMLQEQIFAGRGRAKQNSVKFQAVNDGNFAEQQTGAQLGGRAFKTLRGPEGRAESVSRMDLQRV